MDLSQFAQLSLIGGVATLAAQLLESPYIPVPAQNHPRFTAILVSVAASSYVVWQGGSSVTNAHDWAQWVALCCGTLIVSVNVYNHLLRTN